MAGTTGTQIKTLRGSVAGLEAGCTGSERAFLRPILVDTTLREGELTAGVKFSLSQKLRIAEMLTHFGVGMIEAGHPFVSSEIKEAVTKISGLGLPIPVLAHARARKEDIDSAAECGAQFVGIWYGINKLSLENKHREPVSKEEAHETIARAISYAQSLGLCVRYTIEDATRTPTEDVIEVVKLAVGAGAERVSIADTVGVAEPAEFGKLVSFAVSAAKEANPEALVHVHCHNDLGMAVANTLSGYSAGALGLDVTVNGLGERSGIAPLHSVASALSHKYKVGGFQLWYMPLLSETVSEYSGVPIHPQEPIIGEHAFSVSGGTHIHALMKNQNTCQAFLPELVGRSAKLVKSEFSGRNLTKDIEVK